MLTNDRKQIKQTATATRGQRLSTIRMEAARPAAQSSLSARGPFPSQSRVGAYQNLSRAPRCSDTFRRYSPAGRIPSGPFSPRI